MKYSISTYAPIMLLSICIAKDIQVDRSPSKAYGEPSKFMFSKKYDFHYVKLRIEFEENEENYE